MTQSTSLLGISYAIHINVFRLTPSTPSHSHMSIGMPTFSPAGCRTYIKLYFNAHFTKSNVYRLSSVATSYLYLSSASGLLRGVRKIPQNSVFSHISHLNGIVSPLIKAFNRFYPWTRYSTMHIRYINLSFLTVAYILHELDTTHWWLHHYI